MYKLIDRDFFVREEKERTILFIRERSAQFLLNASGKQIFDVIVNNNDLENVKTIVFELFPEVDQSFLVRDIDNIFNMLEIYGIVESKSKSDNILVDSNVIAIDENEYNLVEEFIERNRRENVLINGPKGYYTPQNVRAHVMNNQEYYYAYVEDGEIKNIMIIIPNLRQTSVVNITALVFEKKLSDNKKKESVMSLLEFIKKNMLNQVNKFRISYYANNNQFPDFLKDIKEVGFKYENVLKNEYKDMDLYLYEYVI